MSNMLDVTVFDEGRSHRYLLKRAGALEARQSLLTARQSKILNSFNSCSRELGYFESIYVGYDTNTNFLILKYLNLPSISQMISRPKLLQPLIGYPILYDGVAKAGHWLRNWHDSTCRHGSFSHSLREYVSDEGRLTALESVPKDTRTKFYDMLESCPDGDIVTIHGDFTVQNVMTDGKRLTVIDPGVWEWTEMTPCWDIAAFLVSLEDQLNNSIFNQIYWKHRIFPALKNEFLSAYGGGDWITNNNIYHVCAAIRRLAKFHGVRDNKKAMAQFYREKFISLVERYATTVLSHESPKN